MLQFGIIVQRFLDSFLTDLGSDYLAIDLLETEEAQGLAHNLIIY
jgi:hypothetical protein